MTPTQQPLFLLAFVVIQFILNGLNMTASRTPLFLALRLCCKDCPQSSCKGVPLASGAVAFWEPFLRRGLLSFQLEALP
jgi:hypothetical protein